MLRFIIILFFTAVPLFGNPIKGSILSNQGFDYTDSEVSVSFEFDHKTNLLKLTYSNVIVNAAALSLKADLIVKDGSVIIRPTEVYGVNGSYDSVKSVKVSYSIKTLKPGIYTVLHDDINTEGSDSEIYSVIDLVRTAKGISTISFYNDPEEDPFR